MARKYGAVILLSFLSITFIVASTAFGADKPFQRAKDRPFISLRHAPIYGFGGTEQGIFEAPKNTNMVALGEMGTNAVGTQVGSTKYDYQHNGTMGRQVEHRGTNYVHFDWMRQDGTTLGVGRGVGTESYRLTTCGLVYGSGGKFATVDYGGYCTIDADAGGCAIPGAHEGADNATMRPRAYWDFCAGGPFGLFTSDYPTNYFGWYQNAGLGPDNQNLWPVVEQQVGTATVLHMVTSESGGAAGDPATCSYYRRVGPYGAGSGVWSTQRVVDTNQNINITVTASKTTDKVAIVWNRPCDYLTFDQWNQYENDVWYVTSNTQGANWVATGTPAAPSIHHQLVTGAITTGGNITNYQPSESYKAYCDMSAIITSDNNLHIVWGCRRWTDTTTLYRRQSAIFHWSEDVPNIRTVAKAEWDTGGACYAYAWGSDAAKMSISECDGKLYVLYTQFGNATAPCYDFDATNTVVNGELYMTVSDDHGLNWDRPQNLTNTVTHQCATGACESDYWATMARFGRTEVCGPLTGQKVLDILYINDRATGGVVQPESGVWTTNPVMWFRTPCRNVVPEPGYTDNAPNTGYGECYGDIPLVLKPNTDTNWTITLENTGLLDNDFNVSISYTDGSGWVTVLPLSGTIPSGLANTIDLDVTVNAPVGAVIPSVWRSQIQITHQAIGSPRTIPICLVVDTAFYASQNATIATACKRFRVYNTGEMVNNGFDAALDFIDDCDTFNANTESRIYLYDGSPVVCRIVGSDTLRYTMYSKAYTDDDAMRPMKPIVVDSLTHPAYTYAKAEYVTADSTIGFTSEYYAPSDPDTCEFVVVIQKFFARKGPLNGVFVGDFLDFDVPSDSGSSNGSGYNIPKQLIYQFGGEYNQDDSTEALCSQESNARYAGVFVDTSTVVKNMMTINNGRYVYTTTSPWGVEAPLPPGPTYELMKLNGFSTWSSAAPESLYIDLSTLITFGQYNLTVGNPIKVIKVFVTTKDYYSGFWDDVYAKAMAWIAGHGLRSCCNKAGDSNNDNVVNVGDAVYVINYVFKGGPTPPCKSEADANGDNVVNVGDAVYVINYVFKGGPTPKCGNID